MKRVFIFLASVVLSLAAYSAERTDAPPSGEAALKGVEASQKTDSEIWNEGVSLYRTGDMTNALEKLRPLMLSRSHGPRAAEVVAAICHARVHSGESADPAADMSEAAAAAQIALKANPKDARAGRNFTRAVDGLPELLRTKHVSDVLKAAQGKDPAQMLAGAFAEARALMDEAASYRTNAASVVVAKSDSLSARASRLADVWLPVKESIAASVTNEEQAATIIDQTEQARKRTLQAARELADLEDGAFSSISSVESAFTRFFKLVAPPPMAIRQDLVSQSNSWDKVATVNDRDWQLDALDYTRAFRAKFPAWAKAYEQQAQADTNMAPFTAEAQAKISDLSTQLEKLQLDCAENPTSEKRYNAMTLIREIIDLLPPEKGGGGQQGQQGQQGQNDQKQNQDQNQDQKDNKDEGDDGQRQEENPEQQEDEQQDDGSAEDEKESPEEREVEALLKKAQERSDEHEAEKKARMRKAKLPPNERDW